MVNLTGLINVDEMLPSERFDIPKVALAARFTDDGNALSVQSVPIDSVEGTWEGIAILETALVRLNTSYALLGNFSQTSASSPPGPTGTTASIGYDAAVCVLLYEPWVVEAHSGGGPSGSPPIPVSTALVGPGTAPVDQNTFVQKERIVGQLLGGDTDRKIEAGTSLRSA
ncbi:hypothetical protein EST38_g9252 [Candolleomyces aberdarensis]|uniref:Uncharacterized protein n=1 Tax=Candolleomyces aberdarensis TaxID=2316362 RepID=A0A4Q2DC54_9AGAR|nr:hypothetical protein EST38_g9252 [Candolleomyces aberdarensis]